MVLSQIKVEYPLWVGNDLMPYELGAFTSCYRTWNMGYTLDRKPVYHSATTERQVTNVHATGQRTYTEAWGEHQLERHQLPRMFNQQLFCHEARVLSAVTPCHLCFKDVSVLDSSTINGVTLTKPLTGDL